MNLLSIITLLTVLATNPNIEYSGRIDFSKPEAPQFSYSGVAIRASIDASTISATLKEETGGNRSEAARRLQITRKTLLNKLKSYGIA